MSRQTGPKMTLLTEANAEMKSSDEINNVTADLGDMAAALKKHQDELLSYGRKIESFMASRTAELAKEKASMEIGVAGQVAQLKAANAALQRQATELTKRNQEITLFSNMNDFLQTCATEAEAYSVITDTAAQLFPAESGALFVFNDSRDALEPKAVWGAMPPVTTNFSPSECWASRRGQSHRVLNQGQRCPHVAEDTHRYVCQPLFAQGEMLGTLHVIDGPVTNDNADEIRVAEMSKLAKTLADNIGLGIANLKLRETMRNLSLRDPLTGLFNRRYMAEALAQEQHRTHRNGTQMAMIMIDIDHFKQFNDTFGHDGGDAVLRELGGFLKKHVRGSDIACRYGGEEFILVLSPTTEEGARQRAEKIREDATLLRVKHVEQELGPITLSMGVVIFPDGALDAAAIIKEADLALYQAKSNGRNQVVMFAQQAGHHAIQRSEGQLPEFSLTSPKAPIKTA